MKQHLKRQFISELNEGRSLYMLKKYTDAFYYFERAHVLGQAHIYPHFLIHWWMLKLAIRTLDTKEILGQIIRLPLSLVGSFFSKLPSGNTGGSNIGMFEEKNIPEDLKKYLG